MRTFKVCGLLLALAAAAGCTSNSIAPDSISKTTKGAGIGAATGAVIGAVVSHNNRGKGAAIGAAVGGTVGAALGYRADKQEAELRARLQDRGVDVQGDGDAIKLVLPGSVSFGSGSAELRPTAFRDLNLVAASLRDHPASTVQVIGHTDRKGRETPNDRLSLQRAQAVSQYLIAQGIAPDRVEALGMGASQPIADNNTVTGRSQNRRVEIRIKPHQQDVQAPQ
jgi:outer membrane protein OmpA-like peptidoglycan-associated protein